MKNVALVLSGGGFRGAFQVGALNYLEQNWNTIFPDHEKLQFDIVSGVSVGSLNGLLVASDEFSVLQELWMDIGKNGVEEIYSSDVINTQSKSDQLEIQADFSTIKNKFIPNFNLGKIGVGQGFKLLFSKKQREKFIQSLASEVGQEFKANFNNFRSLANNQALKDKLSRFAKAEKIKGKFVCGYVSLNTGKFHSRLHSEFKSDSDFAKAVEASTAIPLVWEPVEQVEHDTGSDYQLVDGGVRDVSPLGSVIHMMDQKPGVENVLVVINCSSGLNKADDYSQKNIAQLALRSLNDIAISEIFNNDLKEFIDKNYILEQVRAANPDLQIYDFNYRTGQQGKPLNRFKAVIINPDPHVLGDSLVANEKLIKQRLAHGYEKAAHAFGEYLNQDDNRDFTVC